MKKYAILLLTLLCALLLWGCGQKQDNAETTLHIAAAFGSNELNELIGRTPGLRGRGGLLPG